MDVKPIHTSRQHREAMKEIERLLSAKPGTPEHDRLEVLGTLVADYEDRHEPILPPDPVDAIQFRIEQLGLDRKALEPCIGSRARVSEIMTRRRSLTLPMIRRLHATFAIPTDVLVGASPKRGKGSPLNSA